MPSGFVGGSATLSPLNYSKAGTYTVPVTPRAGRDTDPHPQDQLLIAVEDALLSEGVKPCEGRATATVTVWDPYTEPKHLSTMNLPPSPACKKGPNPPGPGPVEMAKVQPGAAVALNPQPLPPGGMHTEALKTGRGTTGGNGASALASVPYVRKAVMTPTSVPDGEPARITITADSGCNAVLIAWGDGTTQDQSLDPRNPGTERPIQHVYRKLGAETVKVSGEHGCFGQVTASVMVTLPFRRPMGSSAQVTHR